MKPETITWHELPADGMPYDGITVLMEILDDTGLTEVWQGWRDDNQWRDASTGGPVGGTVVAWAHMPAGARTC